MSKVELGQTNKEITFIQTPDFQASIEVATNLSENDPDCDYLFLIDLDGPIAEGLKAFFMKFPFAHTLIEGDNFISDENLNALAWLNHVNRGGIAIVTNRREQNGIWRSERLMFSLRQNLIKVGLGLPIFTDTDRMVPEKIRAIFPKKSKLNPPKKDSIFYKEDRWEELIKWINERRIGSKPLKICIISDWGIEALTENIYMNEVLSRVEGASGIIIQASRIKHTFKKLVKPRN